MQKFPEDSQWKIATCSCKALQVRIKGPLEAVVACHCQACQHRTGSVFGVGAYYNKKHVEILGIAKAYRREVEDGRTFTSYFCPHCGTSLYWFTDLKPGIIGIAVGAFGDRQFPAPDRSVWEENRYSWVNMDSVPMQHFPKGRSKN